MIFSRWFVAGCFAGVVAFGRDEFVSDAARVDRSVERPAAWPGGVVPYDVSKLSEGQVAEVLAAFKLWEGTGANISFVPRTSEAEYVFFTGRGANEK